MSVLLSSLYLMLGEYPNYCKTSNISLTLIDNKTVNHSDVVGASLVGAAPTTSSVVKDDMRHTYVVGFLCGLY